MKLPWGCQDPGGPHVGHTNLSIWVYLPTRIICKDVSGFVSSCPYGVWCHGLTTYPSYIGPLFGKFVLNYSCSVRLVYWREIYLTQLHAHIDTFLLIMTFSLLDVRFSNSFLSWFKYIVFAYSIVLTHRGRVTHICVGNLTIIGSDNGLSPGRRQAIIWTNARILLTEPLGTIFSEILIAIQAFSFKKMHFKMLSAKWRPFCLCLNVLTVF